MFHYETRNAIKAALILLMTTAVSARAVEDPYPEIVPGPGLPSLAELGKTSRDFYDMTPAEDISPNGARSEASKLFERDTVCRDGFDTPCNVNEAYACANYLISLGTTECRVGAGQNGLRMCTNGGCGIFGGMTNYQFQTPVSSYW